MHRLLLEMAVRYIRMSLNATLQAQVQFSSTGPEVTVYDLRDGTRHYDDLDAAIAANVFYPPAD